MFQNKNQDPLELLADEALVRVFLETKDKKYFEAIYERYERKVYGRCMMILKDTEESQDVMQEVFVKIYFKLDTFRGDAKLGTWIHRIATNACLNWISKKSRTSEVVIDEEVEDLIMKHTDDPLKQLLASSKRDLIQQTLQHMDRRDTIIILMKYSDGLRMDEMAEVFDIGEGAMKVRLFRARKKFVEIFEALDEGRPVQNSKPKKEKKNSNKEKNIKEEVLSNETQMYLKPQYL